MADDSLRFAIAGLSWSYPDFLECHAEYVVADMACDTSIILFYLGYGMIGGQSNADTDNIQLAGSKTEA